MSSKAGAELARARWSKTTREERLEVVRRLNEARRLKREGKNGKSKRGLGRA